MPKTFSDLAHLVYSFDNLDAAFHDMSKGMRYRRAVLAYRKNYEENIINLQNHLIWKTYQVKPYKQFIIHEPKKRLISAPDIEDRLVQHALCRIVEPLFERRFIYSSYACRKGKGMLGACKRIQHYIRQQPKGAPVYYLRMDFRKYFHSIPHDLLKRLIRRVISDKWVLWLFDTIIDSYHPGLPIGALTSQLLANVVGDNLDHYICEELGVRFYARYMDDIIIVSSNMGYLKGVLQDAQYYIENTMGLSLNVNKSHVAVAEYPYRKKSIFAPGIDFAGYIIHRDRLLPRKRNIANARRRLRVIAKKEARGVIPAGKAAASAQSFMGYIKHCKWSGNVYSALTSIKTALSVVRSIA